MIIIWYVWFSKFDLVNSNNITFDSGEVEYSPELNNFIETYCVDKEAINSLNLNHEYMLIRKGECAFNKHYHCPYSPYYGFPISVNKFIKNLDDINVDITNEVCNIRADLMEELQVIL